jgi:hypothetical protein
MKLNNDKIEFDTEFSYDYNDELELPKNLKNFMIFEKDSRLEFNLDELDDIEITIEMNKPKQETVYNGYTKIFEKESKSKDTDLF